MSTVELWLEQFKNRADFNNNRLPWLLKSRKQAMDKFASLGWPNMRTDGWRHTPLTMLQQNSFQTYTDVKGNADSTAVIKQLKGNDAKAHWLIFVDGNYQADLSTIGDLPKGVSIQTLSQLNDDNVDEVSEIINTETKMPNITNALNLAMLNDGAFIKLASGVMLEPAIHLVFITQSPSAAAFNRNIIIADAGSSATVVEHFVSANEDIDAAACLSSAVTHTKVAENANLTHAKIQLQNLQDFHLAAIDTEQQKSSVFNSHSMSFGAKLARNDISTSFLGEHCETLFNGLYYANDKRHVDHTTLINHDKPNGNSREFYRGILDNQGRGVFSGRVLVGVGADGTDSEQRCDNLLLSKLAKADAMPELEIYADDVACAHGATVGQLDEDALFYLQSRGMDLNHARNILIYAFAAQIVERITVPSLRDQVIGLIRARLPGASVLGDI